MRTLSSWKPWVAKTAALTLRRVLDVVAVAPELVDVAVRVTVAGVDVGVVGDVGVDRLAERAAAGERDAGRVARAARGGDRRVQAAAGVVRVVADAAGARVQVPGGDRRDRHDRLQALDARGGDAVGERAVVGLADHRARAVVPVGDDLGRGQRRGLVGLHAAVEPVDDRLLAGDVAGAAVHRAAVLGVARAVHLAEHVRVAARDEVVVQEQRPAVVEVVVVPVGHALGLVAAADRRVVRATGR